MKARIAATAQRLLNLYRQEHVIVGGWATLTPVFIAEATDDVIKELREMPTGKVLIQHIENLRSGKTPMDSIESDLIPYGGLMTQSSLTNTALNKQDITELQSVLADFTPDQSGLEQIERMNVVHRFGEEWPTAIHDALDAYPHMQEKWKIVTKTFRAYQLWDMANQIINMPLDERARAEIQAEMPEYETYLPMFGDAGNELLGRLRTFISSIKSEDKA